MNGKRNSLTNEQEPSGTDSRPQLDHDASRRRFLGATAALTVLPTSEGVERITESTGAEPEPSKHETGDYPLSDYYDGLDDAPGFVEGSLDTIISMADARGYDRETIAWYIREYADLAERERLSFDLREEIERERTRFRHTQANGQEAGR